MPNDKVPEAPESMASSSAASDTDAPDPARRWTELPRPRRQATLYDAIAGRVVEHRPLDRQDVEDQQLDVAQNATGKVALGPDEVLFRRRDAPQRFMEHDIYQSHMRDLPEGGRRVLPQNDLLKALHGYVGKFYEAIEGRQGSIEGRSADFRSMDESALLAFGILLEEAGREALGHQGDLVFTEGVDDAAEGSTDGKDAIWRPVDHHDLGSWLRGPRKKRKLDPSADGTSGRL